MDIAKHIKQHTKNVQNGLILALPEQRQNLKITALGFYMLLPDFEKVISKYIKEKLKKVMLKLMSIQTTMKNPSK